MYIMCLLVEDGSHCVARKVEGLFVEFLLDLTNAHICQVLWEGQCR